MPRVPEEVLARLKREVSIERLVEASGVQLQKRGADLVGLCPFHDDTEPSLVVSPAKNLWHCLGACGAGGSVIDWVMKAQGVSFRHAVELLREGLPPLAAGGRGEPPPKLSTVRRLPCPVSAEASEGELLGQVAAYYHQVLQESPDALGYLEHRGLRDEEAIERFQLGFADRTLGLRLPQRNRKAGKELRERLAKLGVFRDSGHEHLAGSVVVPIPDRRGRVVNLYGRKVNDGHLRPGTPQHLYLPGPHRGVWNLEGLASPELILCESLLDALTFWCAGFRNVTTSYGVNGFTRDLFEALLGHGIERVLIAYDRDKAGDQAAEALAAKLSAEGIGCFRVAFPRGMDANAYALKVTPAKESLGLVLRSAEWMAGPTARSTSVAAERPPSPGAATSPVAPESQPSNRILFDEAQAQAESSPAAPVVPAAGDAPELPAAGEPVEMAFGERRYRVRGWEKNLSYEKLQVMVRVATREAFFVDALDLVSARQRGRFIQQTAVELGVKEEVVKKDLAKLHFQLEGFQDALIQQTLQPPGPQVVALSPEEERQALELLRDPRLLERILGDFQRLGVVGEETNKLVGYLAAVSRKLDRPLGVMVQSSSAAGKSVLLESVLSLVPEEERVQYSAMTGQSLFYMGETDLKHRLLAVAEEEGAERASYALKLLQSEGKLSIASTGKDPQTGRLVTHEYRVEGPVALLLTTTAVEIDEELQNRCLVLSVDEGREQTRAIHELQRQEETLEGLLAAEDRLEVTRLHQNAQRLLRPLRVTNPYARELTFLDDRTRTRRDHKKYLTLIRAIALLHQHQRPKKKAPHRGREVEYLEATVEDIAAANRLAHEVLGRSLDELPPQTRRLLELLDAHVAARCEALGLERADFRFSRREVREVTGWSQTQVQHHLRRLVELEYLAVHRGGRGQSFVYELLYGGEGKDGSPFVLRLIDVEKLSGHRYDGNLSGSGGEVSGAEPGLSGSNRGQIGPKSGGYRIERSAVSDEDSEASEDLKPKVPRITSREKGPSAPSYPRERRVAAAGRKGG